LTTSWTDGSQIPRIVVTVPREAARDETVDCAGALIEQLGDIVVPRQGQRTNAPAGRAGSLECGVDPVQREPARDQRAGWLGAVSGHRDAVLPAVVVGDVEAVTSVFECRRPGLVVGAHA